LGALRVVGVPARFVFDASTVSTFDRLRAEHEKFT
jgi:hypothetical protein